MALLTRRVAVTSARDNPFNVRFAKRALRAPHKTIARVCCFVKPFGMYYTTNRTQHCTSHVSPANMLVVTCVLWYKLFNCALRHRHAAIIINSALSRCALCVIQGSIMASKHLYLNLVRWAMYALYGLLY